MRVEGSGLGLGVRLLARGVRCVEPGVRAPAASGMLGVRASVPRASGMRAVRAVCAVCSARGTCVSCVSRVLHASGLSVGASCAALGRGFLFFCCGAWLCFARCGVGGVRGVRGERGTCLVWRAWRALGCTRNVVPAAFRVQSARGEEGGVSSGGVRGKEQGGGGGRGGSQIQIALSNSTLCEPGRRDGFKRVVRGRTALAGTAGQKLGTDFGIFTPLLRLLLLLHKWLRLRNS